MSVQTALLRMTSPIFEAKLEYHTSKPCRYALGSTYPPPNMIQGLRQNTSVLRLARVGFGRSQKSDQTRSLASGQPQDLVSILEVDRMHQWSSGINLEVRIKRMNGRKRGERWDLRDLAPLESLF